jgi:hypothetical protein
VESLDRRRKGQLDQIHLALDRARALPPEDRSLVRAILSGGQSAVTVSRLTGEDAQTIRRRTRRLCRRLLSPEFTFVLHGRAAWPEARRRVATACFLHGRSTREAAAELGMSMHTVRQHHQAIRALYESSRTPAPDVRACA